MAYHVDMNETTTRTPFQRKSLQVNVGTRDGLTPETNAAMIREARMGDMSLGQLLERMWAAYTAAQSTEKQPAANGRHGGPGRR